MCPSNLALHHPAANTLLQYATGGCPTNTGQNRTKEQIQEAIDRGPHASAKDPVAMAQQLADATNKEKKGQCRIVLWGAIKDDPSPHLKISPIAVILHKSRLFQAILDLLFKLRLKDGGLLNSVNDATTLSGPSGAIDQLGHLLQRVIHAFAEAGGGVKRI